MFSTRRSFYDSKGDYESDAVALEDSSLPIYSHGHTLPSLPVPTIEESLKIFLPSALPLAKTKIERDALLDACRTFPTEAASLQERLLERAESLPDSSWLQYWWNTRGYLQVRSSNVLDVSYFLRMDRPSTRMTALERSAAVLHATYQYASRLLMTDAGNMEHLTKRMCPTQFKYLFRSCRIPGIDADTYRVYEHSHSAPPDHAVVAINGQFFSVPLADSHGPLTTLNILGLLQSCKDKSMSSTVPELGWLTTQFRDNWFQDYKRIQTLFGSKVLDVLQSGLVLLAIDEAETNLSDSDQALLLWHGCSQNRWHDKSIQVVVTGDGEIAGIIGEHSMADGMPTVGYCHHLQEETQIIADHSSDSIQRSTAQPELIFEKCYQSLSASEQEEVQRMADEAKSRFTLRTQKHTLKVVRYPKLGKTILKKAGLAPDAAVQIAMQLASSRYYGTSAVATYEAVQTRVFRHGRTETSRSVNTSSAAMCNELSWSNLQAACDAHTAYTRLAMKGKGCDRHFLGLEYLLQPGEHRPRLLDDPIFLRSKTWLISTSTVPTLAPGFGPPGGGFGIGYDVRAEYLIFTVSGDQTQTSVQRFCELLTAALDDINRLMKSLNLGVASKL